MDTRNDPIAFSDEDRLGRAPTAKVFAKALMANPGRPMTVAVYGPWGSGKTSFANLIVAELRATGVACAWFNPWQFTNVEALTLAFFDLLAQSVAKPGDPDYAQVREDFLRYAFSVTSLALLGSSAARQRIFARRFGASGELGLQEQKDVLHHHFRSRSKPVIVFIDDIDRLYSNEIRLIIQLVKSNADFANLKFVLLFQKETVEAALKTDGQSGADFLEKIIEVPIELPLIRSSGYVTDFLQEVTDIFGDLSDLGTVDAERWQFLVRSGVLAPFRTLRRKNRLLDRLQLHKWNVEDGNGIDINLVDLLALEILRSLDYELYSAVRRHELALTEVGDSLDERCADGGRCRLDKLVSEAGPGDHELGRILLSEMFPLFGASRQPTDAAQDERMFRICRSKHFPKYFLEGLLSGEMSSAIRKQLEDAAMNGGDVVSLLSELRLRGLLFDALDHLGAIASRVPASQRETLSISLTRAIESHATARSRGFGRSIVSETTGIIQRLHDNATEIDRTRLIRTLANTAGTLQATLALVRQDQWFDSVEVARLSPRIARAIGTAAEEGKLEKFECYGLIMQAWRMWAESRAIAFVRQISTDPTRFTEFARAIAPSASSHGGVTLTMRTRHLASADAILDFLPKRTALKAVNNALTAKAGTRDEEFLKNLARAIQDSDSKRDPD